MVSPRWISASSVALLLFFVTGSLAPVALLPGAPSDPVPAAGAVELATVPDLPQAETPDPRALVRDRIQPAMGLAEDAAALAQAWGQGDGAAALLSSLAGSPTVPQPSASPDLPSALARLEGTPADPDAMAGLPVEYARPLADMVDALHWASLSIDQAFSGLTAAERAELMAALPGLDTPRSIALADRVDGAELRAAARVVDDAARAFTDEVGSLPALPASAPAGPVLPGPGAGASALAVPCGPSSNWCNPHGSSIVSPGGMVEVGFTMANTYSLERLLIFDGGGPDCYQNYPASYGPGSGITLPLSVILDKGGDDTYVSTFEHPLAPPGTTWGSAVALGGIAALYDEWGNDFYYTALNNAPSNCAQYGATTSWQRAYGQGVAILGVAILADTGGNDYYATESVNTVVDPVCQFGRAYAYGQAYAARLGVAGLVDYTGNDRYNGYAYAEGKQHNSAHTHAQAVASARGIAALVDDEGDDGYFANAHAHMLPASSGVQPYSAMGYAFAQAALTGNNEPRGEGIIVPPVCDPQVINCDGINCTIQPCPIKDPTGVGIDCNGFTVRPIEPGQLPALSDIIAAPVGPKAGVPFVCDLQGYAILADLLGLDVYRANSRADDSFNPTGGPGCLDAAWAGTAAQGSAPAKGVALLVDGALDTINKFTADANAHAKGCGANGVRAFDASQGYGGAFMWDNYDRPPFDPLLVTNLSLGALVRGGMCGNTFDLSGGITLQVPDPEDPCADPAWADDSYTATSTADNYAPGPSWSQTFAQGAGHGHLILPDGTTFDALGIGVHADTFGNDAFYARANAYGAGLMEPFTAAQGAGVSGGGILLNVGDVDEYYAESFDSFGAMPLTWQWVVAQADALVPFQISFTVCDPTGTVCNITLISFGMGILVDVWGFPSDAYNVPYPFGCPGGGPLPAPFLAPARWGRVWPDLNPIVCTHNPGVSTGLILGFDN